MTTYRPKVGDLIIRAEDRHHWVNLNDPLDVERLARALMCDDPYSSADVMDWGDVWGLTTADAIAAELARLTEAEPQPRGRVHKVQRRGKAAAEAAIAEATGVEVVIDNDEELEAVFGIGEDFSEETS